MEKYFKIEIRLADGVEETISGDSKLVNKYYYGDGYIKIADDMICGHIALDYLEGEIGEEIIEIYLFTENKVIEIEIPKEEFCLPQDFLIVYDDITVDFSVKDAVNNKQKQNWICKQNENARIYVGL